MTCTACGSERLFQTRFISSGGGQLGFHLDTTKGRMIKKGITPEVWVCEDCRHIQFKVPQQDLEYLPRL